MNINEQKILLMHYLKFSCAFSDEEKRIISERFENLPGPDKSEIIELLRQEII